MLAKHTHVHAHCCGMADPPKHVMSLYMTLAYCIFMCYNNHIVKCGEVIGSLDTFVYSHTLSNPTEWSCYLLPLCVDTNVQVNYFCNAYSSLSFHVC